MEDFEFLFDAARSLNRYVRPALSSAASPAGSGSGTRPGDDFCKRGPSWAEILEPHGWKQAWGAGDKVYWRRPGKDGRGWSATTGHCRTDARGDLLYVFSSSAAPFETERTYSKFEAWCVLNYGGDFRTAAQALLDAGYGDQPIKLKMIVPGQEQSSSAEQEKPSEDPAFRVIPASQLKKADEEANWLWKGYLSRNGITLLSALWKAGKTTLLAHLMKSLEEDGKFCGVESSAARILYVTEEHETLWADRRDLLGLRDHIHFIIRPFMQKPRADEWIKLLQFLQEYCQANPIDLIVFDTLSNLWPVKDENDAPHVQAALMPLHAVAPDVAFLLVHHLRKSDGQEATGARGSGALPAFVDTILELRRYNASDTKDRRRVITGVGRYQETPAEVVIELSEQRIDATTGQVSPGHYVAHGDRSQVSAVDLAGEILRILPVAEPGFTYNQIVEAWDGKAPTKGSLLYALHDGAEKGRWRQSGEGKKGSPFLFWAPRQDSVFGSSLYRDKPKTESSGDAPADSVSVNSVFEPEKTETESDGALQRQARETAVLVALSFIQEGDVATIADRANQSEPQAREILQALAAAGKVRSRLLASPNGPQPVYSSLVPGTDEKPDTASF